MKIWGNSKQTKNNTKKNAHTHTHTHTHTEEKKHHFNTYS